MAGTRRDGRKQNQIRPMEVEQGLLNRADGSSRFVQGNTSVLAAVYGPAPAKFSAQEKADRARVEVDFREEKGFGSGLGAEMAMFLRRSLEGVILLAHYPRTVISIIVQVIIDDGAVLSTALNAATVALINAGVEMTALALSVTCCVCSMPSRSIVLDPCKMEEDQACATTVLATENAVGGVLSSRATGAMSKEEYFACCEAAVLGSAAVRSFVRLSAEQKIRRELETIR
ncbi:unnamed protein product [Discosporangium mesarthrocarpum]